MVTTIAIFQQFPGQTWTRTSYSWWDDM